MKTINRFLVPIMSAIAITGCSSVNVPSTQPYAQNCTQFSYTESARNDIELLSVVYSRDVEKGKLEFSREADMNQDCKITQDEAEWMREEEYSEIFGGEPSVLDFEDSTEED
ncbi:MAG: hypothetical protein WC755_09665 [Candidatus Woesearchaeota archaeon]|jgi:hypothetical protein